MENRIKFLFTICLLTISSTGYSKSNINDHSVYILANIGTLEANSKEILSFEKVVKNHDAPYSIIIPGDKEWSFVKGNPIK